MGAEGYFLIPLAHRVVLVVWMRALAYVVGVAAGFVEALVTLPWLAAANFLPRNIIEHDDKLYQLFPLPPRELSWIEIHAVLPLANTKLFGILPATSVIWFVSILLSGVLSYYVAKRVVRRARMS